MKRIPITEKEDFRFSDHVKVGMVIATNFTDRPNHEPIVGCVGEINEETNSVYIWQNEMNGAIGKEHPSSRGFMYSYYLPNVICGDVKWSTALYLDIIDERQEFRLSKSFKKIKLLKKTNLLEYAHALKKKGKIIAPNIKRIRKTFHLHNDMRAKYISTLREFNCMSNDKGEIAMLSNISNDGYIMAGKRKMKLTKWAMATAKKIMHISDKQTEAMLNKLSQLINTANNGSRVIISNKVADCLTASDVVCGDWGSCQAIKASRNGANAIYYLNEGMYVATIENEQELKTWRAWITKATVTYMDKTEDTGYVMGRQYPHREDFGDKILEEFGKQILGWKKGNIHRHFPNGIVRVNSPEDGKEGARTPHPDAENETYRMLLHKRSASDVLRVNINFNTKHSVCKDCHEIKLIDEMDLSGTCCECGGWVPRKEQNDDDELFTCTFCNEQYPVEDANNTPMGQICNDCYHEHVSICDHCGCPMWNDDAFYIEGDTYCEDCFSEIGTKCDECEDTFHETFIVDGRSVCDACARIIKQEKKKKAEKIEAEKAEEHEDSGEQEIRAAIEVNELAEETNDTQHRQCTASTDDECREERNHV